MTNYIIHGNIDFFTELMKNNDDNENENNKNNTRFRNKKLTAKIRNLHVSRTLFKAKYCQVGVQPSPFGPGGIDGNFVD